MPAPMQKEIQLMIDQRIDQRKPEEPLREDQEAVEAGNAGENPEVKPEEDGGTQRSHSGRAIWATTLLDEHEKAGRPADPESDTRVEKGIRWMKRKRIKTLEEAFQPRTFEGQLGDRHSLIQDLIDAINRAGIERIDPVKVWWSGREWFVVDGHHRLNAVDRVNSYRHKKGRGKVIREVPVEVISGSRSEALMWASRDNGKAHLTLTAKQRSQWAWRVAVLHWSKVIPDRFVMAERAVDLHVHRNTLTNMKAVWKQIEQRFRDEHAGHAPDPKKHRQWIHEVAGLEWPKQAEAFAKGAIDQEDVLDNEWRRAAVRKTAERLIRSLGKEAFSSPGRAEITADALVEASSRFAKLAIGAEDFREAIHEAFMESGEFELEEELEDDEE